MNIKMKPTVQIGNPNERFLIFEGKGKLNLGENIIDHPIKIYQSWFPNDKLIIEAKSIKDFRPWEIDIEIESFYSGKVLVTSKSGFQEIDIEGELENPIINYFSSGKIKKINFCLFNFTHLNGTLIQESLNKKSYSNAELVFKDNFSKLTFHNYISKNERDKFIKTHGQGFLFTTVGELDFSNPISRKEINYYVKRLSLFISFLNGRRSSPRFIKGYGVRGTLIMHDYSSRIVDHYKYNQTWLPFLLSDNLSPLWSEFLEITKDDEIFEKFSLIIHWYLEALNQSAFVDGSIILLQNSYETLFNWIFNEQNEILSIDGIEKLRASDKIRLLLNHFNININLPETYCDKFKNEIKKDKSLENFAYHFTEIRNLYVHYKRKKAATKDKYPDLYNYYLLITGINNLEIIILKMLKYRGEITSRIINDFRSGSNQIEI